MFIVFIPYCDIINISKLHYYFWYKQNVKHVHMYKKDLIWQQLQG